MKAIGIVGFKKSGKTTLTLAIAKALINKGYQVAVIKHSSVSINHEHTDTGKFIQEVPKVAVITPEQTEIVFKGNWELNQIIPFFSVDFLILEGFKSLKHFPKIICLRDESERELLADGLELFSVGMDVSLKENKIVNYSITDEKDLQIIVEQIEQKGFLLPDANCGKCGYDSCYDLAQAIVKGQESSKRCSYLQDYLSIKVNGKNVPLNQFMSKLYQSLINGMLAPLKDIDSLDQTEIEIKANISKNNY